MRTGSAAVLSIVFPFLCAEYSERTPCSGSDFLPIFQMVFDGGDCVSDAILCGEVMPERFCPVPKGCGSQYGAYRLCQSFQGQRGARNRSGRCPEFVQPTRPESLVAEEGDNDGGNARPKRRCRR